MTASLILKDMTLIDGTGRPPQDHVILVIRDGRIAYVGDEAGWAEDPDEPSTVLNFPGRTVLPGLIDCHVHLALEGAPDGRLYGDTGWATLLMLLHAQQSLAAGITTVRDVGVPIAMGTDAATPYNFHGDNAMELLWMAEAGLSPMQTIVAATSNAARALGWDSWLGTLEQGKVADLLIVAGNPLDHLHLLTDQHNIELVIKNGQIVARPPSTKLNGIPELVIAGAWICCGLPSPGPSMLH